MKKVIINENQKGFLFKKGRFSGLLGPGKYLTFGSREIEVVSAAVFVSSPRCPLEVLLANEDVAAAVAVLDVPDKKLGLHFVDGRFTTVCIPGKYAFWSDVKHHEFIITDAESPEIAPDVPEYILEMIASSVYAGHVTKIVVAEYARGLLYFDNKLIRTLMPGTYFFWNMGVKVEVDIVDMRLTKLDIVGQEVMTQDKVTVRVNLVANYRVTDCVRVKTEFDDYKEQLHVASQLALRDYVGKHTLDEILADRESMSAFVGDRLRRKGSELFLDVRDAGIKDIILPGEMRDIMNTVLIAEKRAQANVITRREEVASTRSLLNTAKLMDENKTLYRLKELEFIERICENVGSITLGGNADILSQLTGLVKGSE